MVEQVKNNDDKTYEGGLSKLKIHELAKELNTTSKRLIEKLHEIGIRPKSHMSTLEEDEIERLYKHIGVIKRQGD